MTVYNGYENLMHFYTEMSSILPYSNFSDTDRSKEPSTIRHRIPIPHLVLQALDDPLSTWRSNVASDPQSKLYPEKLFEAESQPNLVVLLTAEGGHVGWPVSWWPYSWTFMNDLVAAGFVDGTVEEQRLHQA